MPGQSDLKRAFAEDGALKTHVGGQALIEGVMMRGKFNWAAAVREPSGNIYIEEHDLASGKKKNSWLYWPVIRGCRAFVESLVLGYKALEIAALHAYAEVSSDDSPNAGEAPVKSSTTREMSTHSASEPESTSEKRAFSWKDDFGNPDEVIDALGAQRTLEVVCEPAPEGETADESERVDAASPSSKREYASSQAAFSRGRPL